MATVDKVGTSPRNACNIMLHEGLHEYVVFGWYQKNCTKYAVTMDDVQKFIKQAKKQ